MVSLLLLLEIGDALELELWLVVGLLFVGTSELPASQP